MEFNTDIAIDNRAVFAVESLERRGYGAWFVGGCVRDALMGLQPNDFDIATSATWQQTRETFASLGCKVIESGTKHGTVTVLVDRLPLEITTYRIDGEYGDGRRPDDVKFTDDIEEDLARRDFRINAIAYHPSRGILDPFDGMGDIENMTVCAVGAAEKRLAEDPLRIIRGLRFSAKLGFSIDANTYDAMRRHAPLLANVAKERILPELSALLCAPHAAAVLRSRREAVSAVLPRVAAMGDREFSLIDKAFPLLPDTPEIRFAALFVIAQDDAEETLRELKACRHMRERVARICDRRYDVVAPSRTAIAMAIAASEGDVDLVEKALFIRQAIDCTSKEDFENRKSRLEGVFRELESERIPTRRKDLSVNGEDIVKSLGLSGKTIGNALDFLLSEAIQGRVENTRDALLEHLGKTGGYALGKNFQNYFEKILDAYMPDL